MSISTNKLFEDKIDAALLLVESGGLQAELINLKPLMAAAAQEVYDAWEQDEEGYDHEFGFGGVCDAISRALADLISENIPDVQIDEYGQPGDDHAALIVHNGLEAFYVDVPAGVYEHGGGFSWSKIQDVIFTSSNVVVAPLDINDVL